MSDVKLIAFYLPQFHPIPENDAAWGEGFTEWVNVRRARPNFVGHYQPHVPGELGYYDLRQPQTRAAQAELARQHGIYGFCYYYYWFNGRRLLHRPLDEVLQSGEPDFPFCVCWANENWTRRWDGGSDEVLVAQSYSADSERRFIEDLLPLLADRRYIRIGGRPLLLVYRVGDLPDPKRATATYREAARRAGIDDLYLACVQHPRSPPPDVTGFDAAVEFPPHGLSAEQLTDQVQKTNPAFVGTVWDYISAAEDALGRPPPPYRQLRGVMTGWDNTPRLQNNGQIFVNTHPKNYRRWLAGVVEQVRRTEDPEQRIVFVNSWNEWGEGCHLEPDGQFGRGYLEATKAALGSSALAVPAPPASVKPAMDADGKMNIPINAPLLVDTVVGAAVSDGLVAKERAQLLRAGENKPLIVVAAAPKSGSTFLVNTLSELTGLPSFRLCSAYSTNEHDLYLPALSLMAATGCVSQLHMKGTFHNAALMRSFGIKPILLVRRIEDIVISLRHDLQEKALLPMYGTGEYGYSFVWQDQCTKELGEEAQLDMIIDLAVPWFVNFYVSWYRLCQQGAVDALWITYEQLFADKEGTLRQILAFLGLPSAGAIDQYILSRRYQTFRDARVGQGATALSARQKARIRTLLSYYPTVDFGRYGISAAD